MDNVLRWDCGPGCGTTGCGNDRESLRRYEEYRRTGRVSREPLIGEPGWEPNRSQPPKKDPWWERLLKAILGDSR